MTGRLLLVHDPGPYLAPIAAVAFVSAAFVRPLRSAGLGATLLWGCAGVIIVLLIADSLGLPPLPNRVLTRQIAACSAILFAATVGASPVIAWTLQKMAIRTPPAVGPPGAGRIIGVLERGLVVAVFPVGGADAVALIFAAKQIARFPAIQRADDNGATAEYILVGSLLSAVIGLAGGLLVAYIVGS